MKTLDPLAGIAAFTAVAEELNFSRASKRLGMSRPTVSAQISDLERRLGVRLLQRTTRMITLTEAGEAYHRTLAGILPQIQEAERVATALQQGAVGHIRMSAPPDLGVDHLAPIIAEFLKLNPKISIDLDLSFDAVNLVEGKFDLAIRGAVELDPHLITRQIGASPIIICAAPEYLRFHGEPMHPEELSSHACLHFNKLRWGNIWPFERGDEQLRIVVKPQLQANESKALLAAAIAGAGIVLLPKFIAGPALRSAELVQVLGDWYVATIPVHAVYPANRHITAKVKALVQLLAERLKGHPDLTADA